MPINKVPYSIYKILQKQYLLTIISLCMGFLSILYGFLFHLFGIQYTIYPILVYIISWFFITYLLNKNRTILGYTLFILFINSEILSFSYLIGGDLGFYLFFIPVSISYIVIVESHKIKLQVFLQFLNILFSILCFYMINHQIFYADLLNLDGKTFFYYLSFVFSYTFILLFMMSIIYKNQIDQNNQDLDKKKLESLNLELEKNNQKIHSILDLTSEGFLIISENRIEEVNDAMAKIIGLPKDELLQTEILSYLDEINADIFQEEVDKLKIGNKTVFEIVITQPNENRLPCLFHATPISDDEGFHNRFFALVTDISEMKFFQKELVKAMRQAGEATKAKSQFLANMSHEIRTPMNAIIGLSGLALNTSLNSKQKDYIQKVNNAGKSLLGIINDILDFSKIESGKIGMESIEFNLEEVLENVYSIVSHKAIEKKLDFNIIIKDDLPTVVKGDSLRLNQVLINLLGNAIKFTSTGEVKLAVSLLEQKEDSVVLLFESIDTGIGISEENIQKLFKPFSQSDVSTSRKYGGTGLGLSISKKLVELMNGKIAMESVLGEGTRVFFHIPFQISSISEDHSKSDLSHLREKSILILDSNREAAKALETILNKFSNHIDTSPSMEEWIQRIPNTSYKYEKYSLFIVSQALFEISGEQIIKEIYRAYDSEKPKIVLKIEDKNKSLQFDKLVDASIPTPFNTFFIQTTIKKLLLGESNKQEGTQYLTLRGSRILLAEDNEVNQQVATELLQSKGIKVEIANNGLEVLQKLKKNPNGYFDMVLMDIQMPEMDGIEATIQIGSNPELKKVPIIAMTAHAIKDELDHCVSVGMVDMIAKPIEPDLMFQTIMKWIQPRENQMVDEFHPPEENLAESSPEPLPSSPDSMIVLKGLDTKNALRRVAGNVDLYGTILKQFYENQSLSLITLKESYDQKNYETIQKITHSIKGSAGNLGYDPLFKAASELEKCIKKNNLEGIEDLFSQFIYYLEIFLNSIQEHYRI
jgi:two-component system, sensor histidine kinase and response regulator